MEDKSIETIIENDRVETQMHQMSRRSFLWAGAAIGSGYAGWYWLTSREQADGVQWPLRCTLEFNEGLSKKIYRASQLSAQFDKSEAGEPKTNGMEGLGEALDPESWQLTVTGPKDQQYRLSLADIKSLPRIEMVTELKCIEGWSQVVHWTGARFSDFLAKHARDLALGTNYVGMSTPDNGYYVGLDMKSATHPQTLLCYEMNGEPLTSDHGAPLRLAIPVKYGIKNIKRIGTITFTNDRPKDYWAEQGYDWYAGH
jgi:DMSO/TMAO reductase YedYZ molybdopterin-dependent catalytic subunit